MKDRLHSAAQVAAVVGAVGSVALTLYAGRNNNLPFLMMLMAGWVLAPFMAYALASKYARNWAGSTRATLDGIIVVVAVTSLAVYGRDVLRPPASKAAAVFVAVPIGAWLLMLIGAPIAALISRRKQIHSACAALLLVGAVQGLGAQVPSDSLTLRKVAGNVTLLLPASWVSLSDTTRARIRRVVDTAFQHSRDTLLQASLLLGRAVTLLHETAPGQADPSANLNVVPSPGLTRAAFEEATPEQIREALAPVCGSMTDIVNRLGSRVVTCDPALVDRESGRTIAVTRLVRSGPKGFVTVWVAQFADAGVVYTLTLGAPQVDEQRYEPLFRTIWRSVQIP
jgi:hypothetical protein